MQAEVVELLTQLRRRVVVCEAAGVAFNRAVIQQPKRFTTANDPADDEVEEALRVLKSNWFTAANNFCKV